MQRKPAEIRGPAYSCDRCHGSQARDDSNKACQDNHKAVTFASVASVVAAAAWLKEKAAKTSPQRSRATTFPALLAVRLSQSAKCILPRREPVPGTRL